MAQCILRFIWYCCINPIKTSLPGRPLRKRDLVVTKKDFLCYFWFHREVLGMLRISWFFSCFALSVSLWSMPGIIVLPENCHSSCTVRPEGDTPFYFSARFYREGDESYIDVQIGENHFTGLSINPRYSRAAIFPFYQYRYPEMDTIKLYGISSHHSTANSYKHYFLRVESRFEYLGLVPALMYDDKFKKFIAFEKFPGGESKYTYTIKSCPNKDKKGSCLHREKENQFLDDSEN